LPPSFGLAAARPLQELHWFTFGLRDYYVIAATNRS
jgi:hypothetical protein